MAEIVNFPLRTRLPRRLLDDGWWLAREGEKPSTTSRTRPVGRRARVILFPAPDKRKSHECC